jgi:hypothetical protein
MYHHFSCFKVYNQNVTIWCSNKKRHESDLHGFVVGTSEID